MTHNFVNEIASGEKCGTKLYMYGRKSKTIKTSINMQSKVT
jgi:hypothetical protein